MGESEEWAHISSDFLVAVLEITLQDRLCQEAPLYDCEITLKQSRKNIEIIATIRASFDRAWSSTRANTN